jgi:hypothetical protein
MKKAEKEAMYDNIQRHGEALLELFPEAVERRPIELCKSLRRLERKASDLRNSPDKYDGWLRSSAASNESSAQIGACTMACSSSTTKRGGLTC